MNSNAKLILALFTILIVMLLCMQGYCSACDKCDSKKSTEKQSNPTGQSSYFTGGYGPNDTYHTPGYYTPPYWTGDYYGQDGYTSDLMFCDRADSAVKDYGIPLNCYERGINRPVNHTLRY